MGGSSRKSEIRKHSPFKMGGKADFRKSTGQKAFELEWQESGNSPSQCIPCQLDILVMLLFFDNTFKTIIYKSKQNLKKAEASSNVYPGEEKLSCWHGGCL